MRQKTDMERNEKRVIKTLTDPTTNSYRPGHGLYYRPTTNRTNRSPVPLGDHRPTNEGRYIRSDGEHGGRNVRATILRMPLLIPWNTKINNKRQKKQLDKQILAKVLRTNRDLATIQHNISPVDRRKPRANQSRNPNISTKIRMLFAERLGRTLTGNAASIQQQRTFGDQDEPVLLRTRISHRIDNNNSYEPTERPKEVRSGYGSQTITRSS